MCRGIEQPEAQRDQKLSLHFVQRTTSVPKELTPFAVCKPSLTFCNVANNRNRCAPELRRQTVTFIVRERARCLVDTDT